MSLVPLPRPAMNGDTVYVHADMLPRLADAERRLGAPIMVRSADAGHREYARQKHYRTLYLQGRGNFAADQDTGERGHMRGSSIDIFREDRVARAAMRAAGFLPDPAEPWHWNLPRHTTYPIIPTRPEEGITMKALFDTRADGRNLFDWGKQILADLLRVGRRQEEINTRAEQRHSELLQAVRDLRPKP